MRHNYPAHIVCCTIFPILELRVECSICFGCKTFHKVSDFSVIYNRYYTFRYGESLFEIGQLEDAETAYQKVVEFAPNHFEARKCLSTILHQLGRFDEALHTLTQDEEAELLNPTLLYERCQLLLAGKLL